MSIHSMDDNDGQKVKTNKVDESVYYIDMAWDSFLNMYILLT